MAAISRSLTLFGADFFDTQKQLYLCITTHYLPGPRSWSYFLTPVLLPLVLLTDPRILPHSVNKYLVFPLMLASTVHAWIAMECCDVASLNMLLWSAFLIAFHDARCDFLRRVPARTLLSSIAAFFGVRVKGSHHHPSQASRNDPKTSTCKEEQQSHGNSEQARLKDCLIESHPSDMLSRIDWVASLIYSTRMQDWLVAKPPHSSSNVACIYRHANYPVTISRAQFVVARLAHLLFNLGSLAVVLSLALNDPWFDQPSTMPITSPLPEASILAELMPWRLARHLLCPWLVRPLVIGGYIYNFVTLPYNVYSLLLVLLNYGFGIPPEEWSPHRLRPFFGSFTAGVLDRGLAGFWGTWWHQHMRVFYTGPAHAAADAFQFQSGRTIRYVLLVYSAFFFSGVTHMGVVPKLPVLLLGGVDNEQATIARAWILRYKIAAFFWVQPLGIALELALTKMVLHASTTWSSKRCRLFSRTFRLIYVVLWLCFTLPLFAEPMAELGYWQVWRMTLPNLKSLVCSEHICALASTSQQLRLIWS